MLPVLTLNLLTAVSVTPSVGSLEFTGGTPTVAVQSWTQRGSLLLALSLNVTTAVGENYTVTPSSGTLTLSGGAPILASDYNVLLFPGTLALAGGTPSTNIGYNIQPSAGSVSLSGNAPALRFDYVTSPTVGSLALSGNTPSSTLTKGCRSFGPLIILGLNLDPDVGGNLTFNIPSTSALVLSTGTPEVTQSGAGDLPSDELVADSATFDGDGYKNAGVTQPEVFPTVGSLTFTGNTPTVTNSLTTLPSVGALSFLGQAPTLDRGYAVQVGNLTLAGGTPEITVSTPAVSPGAGSLSLSSSAISVSRGYYNTYGTLIARRAFIVRYNDEIGTGVLSALPASFEHDINRGAQGDGEMIASSATVEMWGWEEQLPTDETWTCSDDSSDTWTTVTDSTEEWTNV